MAEVLQFPMNQSPPIIWGDVSRYQAMYTPDGKLVSHMDFEKYATKSRVIDIRGGVANEGMDYEFEYNLTACVLNEILVKTIYHATKLWKNIDGQAQIIKDSYDIAKALAPDHYCKRLALDIETNDGLTKNVFTGNCEKLLNRIYNLTGVIADIYTRAIFWNANTYIASWMKDVDWWIAHHFYNLNPYKIPVPRPYLPDCIVKINNPFPPIQWQFDTHDNGADWGSTGDNEIDLNFFTYKGGTAAAFEEKFGKPYPIVLPPPEPPVQGEIVPLKIVRTTAVKGLNIRSLPEELSKDIGTLPLNSDVPVVDESDNDYYEVRGFIFKAYTRTL